MRTLLFLPVILLFAAVLSSCGEDRSDEQPFAPTLSEVATERTDTGVITLYAQILSSKNSHLTACGFIWGDSVETHTLSLDSVPVISTSPHVSPSMSVGFSATIDSLTPGNYFVLAFATNGIGTTRTDTVFFSIEP